MHSYNMLYNLIFINDIDIGVKSNILEFEDDTKMYGKVGTDQGIAALEKDLETLCRWSE